MMQSAGSFLVVEGWIGPFWVIVAYSATASATRRKQLHDSSTFFRRLSSTDTA